MGKVLLHLALFHLVQYSYHKASVHTRNEFRISSFPLALLSFNVSGCLRVSGEEEHLECGTRIPFVLQATPLLWAQGGPPPSLPQRVLPTLCLRSFGGSTGTVASHSRTAFWKSYHSARPEPDHGASAGTLDPITEHALDSYARLLFQISLA